MTPVGVRRGASPEVSIIGVGPGDPELLTLGALKALQACDLVVHAGRSDNAGFAYEVVASFLRADQEVLGAGLTMKRGPDDGSVGYDRVAERLAEASRTGRNAGFLTEGDPMLFGSGSYVVEHLRALAPEVNVRVIPGVSAISAAAARLGWPLAQKHDVLTVCPATYHPSEIGSILDRPGTSCWLKVANVLPVLVPALRERGKLGCSALLENVGRPDERIFLDLDAALHEALSYFSIVLVR